MNAEAKNKRVVFTMGGKGGVGKTGLMVALAEWFEAHEIPFTLLDLDTENKARGSLKHFFNGTVAKVNINTPAGLDTFIDHLESGASIILADMGAGSGHVAIGSTPCTRMSLLLARVSLPWALSRLTRRASRVSLHGLIACKTGLSTWLSKTRQVHKQTSATGTRLSRQSVSAKRCRRS